MNNKLHPKNNNHNHIILSDIMACVVSFNLDPQQTSISLKTIDGRSFSFNWSTRKFNYLRHA